ncbi:hypothetical protein K2X33_06745, partial [bacterium]|nr:hypothetical protein [bacterium]
MRTEIEIEFLGPLGDGVANGPRGPVFVDRTAPGDRLTVRLGRDAQGIVRGEVAEVLSASRFRQPPPCPHYEKCGNCTLQHVQESFYRDWKQHLVKEALLRQALIPQKWETPVFVPAATRRRLTFAALRVG